MDVWKKNFSSHVEHYTKAIEESGSTLAAIGWGSEQSQKERFRVLTEIGLVKGATILDVGCGLGDFYGYLRRDRWPDVMYLGVDITPRMVETARAKYPFGQFLVHDILNPGTSIPNADFVLASGIFALLDLDLDPYLVMTELVKAMFQLCKLGIAFNSLSSSAPHVEPGKFFVDPLKALSIGRGITPWVTIRHDYLPHDFTVYMFREQQRRVP